MSPDPSPSVARLVADVRARLAAARRVRIELEPWGRLYIERPLPFLCVYRRPAKRRDPGTDLLLTGKPSYLLTSAAPEAKGPTRALLRGILEELRARFESVLLLEIWTSKTGRAKSRRETPQGVFRIVRSARAPDDETIATLRRRLERIKVHQVGAEVGIERLKTLPAPPGLSPILPARELRAAGVHFFGLEIEPFFRAPKGKKKLFALLHAKLRRDLSKALRWVLFTYIQQHTGHDIEHVHALGRHSFVRTVWNVDKELSEVAGSFAFILQATPTNLDAVWNELQRTRYARAPRFQYRPVVADPVLLKRRLFRIPIERIEDPTLALFFREKQLEIDRKLSMLIDLGTRRFFHGSMALYGAIEPELLADARALLAGIPASSREAREGKALDATEFAARARRLIARYKEKCEDFDADVEIREDIFDGVMCSRGNLLLGSRSKIPAARVRPLLAHEIETHLVTYYNGKAQPFRQLFRGLTGYIELQEGLAVLGEYLAGGLSLPRLRILAGRVVATWCLMQGADLVETLRVLSEEHGFARRGAFAIASRVYRGGGLTKDIVYLRGLKQVLAYLAKGGELEPLYLGKIAVKHIPVVRELTMRNILKKAPLRPLFLDGERARSKLPRLAQGMSLTDLMQEALG